MKKFGLFLVISGGVLLSAHLALSHFPAFNGIVMDTVAVAQSGTRTDSTATTPAASYRYPEFYRGLYLNVSSANNFQKLKGFVSKSKAAGLNALVLDVQSARYVKCMVPETHVRYCIDNGVHPIARIVVFPDGLRKYPVPDSYLDERIAIAEDACRNGFREIQFDYIRFHDSGSTRHLTHAQRYAFIEGFITKARKRLRHYNPRIAVDVFGRIPLNRNDIIGQQMESLDRVVDMICPMAYPSHYTWSRKFYADPYYTVHKTSLRAKERTKNAMIVTYIQAFKMKMSGIPYDRYVRDQIKAVHDAGIRGYIMWNARQDYELPLAVAREYYSSSISRKERPEDSVID